MRLLKQYAKGSMLFAEAGHGSSQVLGPSPWDYEVYYDPPVAGPVKFAGPTEMSLHATCAGERLLMSFPGVVSDQPACVVADSAATHAFIDRAFVLKHGLREYAASGSVSMAGQKSVPVSSFVRERVKCQALSEVIKMYVVDMPSSNLHVVLVQIWLKSRNAVISYADRRVMFWQGGRHSVLKCVCDDDPVLPPLPAMPSHSLTFMQFQEAIQEKGTKYFVVNVMAADECVAEAAEEGEVPEPNCSKHFKTVLHPVVELFPDVFAELGCRPIAVLVCLSILVTHPLCLSLCTGCPPRRRQRWSDSWLTLWRRVLSGLATLPGVPLSSLWRRRVGSCECV